VGRIPGETLYPWKEICSRQVKKMSSRQIDSDIVTKICPREFEIDIVIPEVTDRKKPVLFTRRLIKSVEDNLKPVL
jgi:hypothetical protein